MVKKRKITGNSDKIKDGNKDWLNDITEKEVLWESIFDGKALLWFFVIVLIVIVFCYLL